MNGITRMTSQAPRVNLVITMITRTTVVSDPPMVLMTCERRIRRRSAPSSVERSSRFQCRTMPHWPMLKLVNTPTMYIWISRLGSASKA